MKKTVKRRLKEALAVFCAIVMLFNATGIQSQFGGTGIEEVQAAGIVPDNMDQMQEISWSDYGVTKTMIRVKMSATTEAAELSGTNLQIRFYKHNESGNIGQLSDSYYETGTVVFGGETATIEFPADKFMEEGKVTGLAWAFFSGPQSSSGNKMTVRVESIEIIGKDTQKADLQAATWTKGMTGGNDWGNLADDGTVKVWNGAIIYSAAKTTFATPINPSEVQKKIRVTMSAETDDISMQGQDLKIRMYKKDKNVNANDAALYEGTVVPLDGTTVVAEFPLDKLLTDGKIDGFMLGLFGGPAYNSSDQKYMTLRIKSIDIVGTGTYHINPADTEYETGGPAGLNPWRYLTADGTGLLWQEAIIYSAITVGFPSAVEPDAVKKTIAVKMSADAEDYIGQDMEVRFYKKGETGNANTKALYESGTITIGAEAATLEFPADKFLENGEIKGLSIGVFNGPTVSATTEKRMTVRVESIEVSGVDTMQVDLQKTTWTTDRVDGLITSGTVKTEGTTNVWSGIVIYSGATVTFAKPVNPSEAHKKIRIKASATTDSPDHQNTTLNVRFYNKDQDGDANKASYENIQMMLDGISQIYELPADGFLSSDGTVKGIEFGIFGGPGNGSGYYTTVRIESIQVLGAEVYDVDLSKATVGKSLFDNLNDKGNVTCSSTELVWNQAVLYGGKQLTFASAIDPTVTENGGNGYTTKNLNNTIFNADVTIKEGGVLYYGAGISGLAFTLNEERLKISAADYDFNSDDVAGEYEANRFGLTSFKDTQFNLKISVSDVNIDKTSAKMCIWINNIVVGAGTFTLTQNVAGAEILDGSMYMTESTVLTADSSMGMSIIVPTDLTDITWEDFGLSCVQAYTDEKTNHTLATTDSLNETLFSGDIVMGAGSTIRYGGRNRNFGLHISVTADDRLSFSSDSFEFASSLPTYEPSRFGLDTLINQRFNLKIAVKDQTETSATFAVWINDVIAGDYFTLSNPKNSDYTMGKSLSLWSGTIAPYSIVEKPELTKVTLQDWCENVAVDGLLKPGEITNKAHPTQDTLVNTSFKETFEFQGPAGSSDTDYLFCYGGMKGDGSKDTSWYGLRISFVGENLKITAIGSSGASLVTHLLDAKTAGIDAFINCEYTLQIDVTKYKDAALVYMYFNGELYGNGPIVLSGFADQMSNTLVYSAYYKKNETDADRTEISAYIGGRDKVLPDYYHDLDEGVYTLPKGLVALWKRTGAGDDAWEEIEAVGGSVLDETGDYKISYNDGVSLYQMEAILYRAGCTTTGASDQRTVVDLVRVLKAVANKQTDSPYKCIVRGYDVDKDQTLDTKDVSELRKYILGSRENTTEMVIAGWRGPNTKQLSEKTYQLLSEAGLNLLVQYEDQFGDDAVSRYPLYQQLSYASKYDMKITLQDARLNGNPANQTEESIRTAMEAYDHFQSFYGLYMLDEPGSEEIYPEMAAAGDVSCLLEDDIQKLAAKVNGMKIPTIGNLIIYKYNYVGNRTAQYKYVSYLRKYVDTFKPTYLSNTRYPFWSKALDTKDGKTIDGTVVSEIKSYFENMAMTRYVANENGIDFRSYVQVGDGYEVQSTLNENDKGNPGRGEFKWNANTALAFGAKGLMYFPAVQPENFVDYSDGTVGSGLIDKKGNTTVWYEYAKEVNAQVKAIDDVLMNAESKGIMATGGYAKTNAYDTVKEIKLYKSTIFDLSPEKINATLSGTSYSGATVTGTDSEYGVLTGCFQLTGKYEGKHAMYLVNFNPDVSQNVTVTFDGETAATYILNAKTTKETAKSVTKTLGGGEAVLVVW